MVYNQITDNLMMLSFYLQGELITWLEKLGKTCKIFKISIHHLDTIMMFYKWAEMHVGWLKFINSCLIENLLFPFIKSKWYFMLLLGQNFGKGQLSYFIGPTGRKGTWKQNEAQ